ncbi:MAG: hypothetical protein WBJ12_00165 [Dethiobacteria bacterium]
MPAIERGHHCWRRAGRESYPRFFRRCRGLVLRESLKPLLPTG